MKDQNKTKAQLIAELEEMRQRVSELGKNGERTDKALKDSLENILAILDSIDADVFVSDLENYEILFMNQHMRSSFGENLVGKICWQVFRGESGPCPHCTNDQLLDADGYPTDVVIWEGQNPITKSWYINHDRAIKWVDGRIVRLQVATDITERMRVEEALRESEEKYRSLVEQANDGITIIQNGIVKFVNPRLAQMRGEQEEEIVGQRITKYIHSDEHTKVLDNYRRRMAGDDALSMYETILQHVDGSQVIAELSSVVISYEGKPAMLVVVRDVTERKQAEQALKESLERLKGFDLHSTEGVYRVDITKPVPIDLPRAEVVNWINKYGVVGEVNDSLAKMYGFEPKDMVGRLAADFAPNHGERAVLVLDEEGYQVKNAETEDVDKDGNPLYLIENFHGIVEDGHLISIWGAQNNITERVQAEKELQRNHSLLTAVLEGTPDVVFVKDHKGRYVISNPARSRLLGLDDAETLGKDDTNFYPPEVARRLMDDDRQVMESGESLTLEEQIVPANGEVRTFLTSKHPWRDGRGKVIGVIGVAHDITERVQAEKALRSAEHEKVTILDSLVEHVVHQDTELRILWANRAACESVDFTREELQGRHCYEIWGGHSEPCTDCPVMESMKTKKPQELEKTTPDGRAWFIRGYPEMDEQGNIVGGIEVTLEITERVQAEKALRESEAKMRSIFKASPTGIGLVSDRVLLDVNEKICEMLGYSQEELIGKNARVLYPTNDDYEYVGREKYAQIQEYGTGTVETRWKRKDGQIINVLLSSTPLDLTDLSAGVTFTALDITDRVKAEEAVRESEARYRTLFEHANDAIFLENQNDEIVDVNRQACELMGYTRDELLQMTVSDLQAPEVRGERGAVLKRELEKHGGELFESMNLHRDGTRIPVEISTASTPGRDDGLVLAIVRDVTERKRAEKALKASEMRFATIFRANPAAIAITRISDNQLIDVNETWQEVTGYKREEAIGFAALDLNLWVNPEQREQLIEMLRNQGKVWGEMQLRRKSGEIGELLMSAEMIELEGEDYLLTMAQDITDRKQMEEALRESEHQKNLILSSTAEMVLYYDTDLRVIWANQASGDSVGKSPEELVGLHCYEIWHNRGEPCDDCPVLRACYDKAPRQGEQQTPDGRHWLVRGFPIFDESGEVISLVEFCQNITERKQAEGEIQGYVNRIEVLLEIEKAITSTLDLDEVLDTIMNELAKVISYDSISLQILRGESLEILACRGFDKPDEVVGLIFPLDPKFPNQCVVEECKPLAIEDVVQEYPHFQSESSKYESGHIRSWLGVPLISKGSMKGMIALDRSKVNPFSGIEIQLATAIANQAVLAIENARLFRDAQRRLERLSSLRQIDRTITGSMDLRITLNILLGHVLQQLEIDAAAVLLYRPEMQSLEFVAGQGFHTMALQSTYLRLGQGFAGQAAFDRRIVQVFDLDQLQSGFSHSPGFRDEMFVAYVGVPLIAKGNIIGVLEIFHRHALDPNPEWIEFLETLAGQAAIAIDNLQLFGDLQTSNLQLRHAYDATIEGWAQALELHDPEPRGYSQQAVDLTLDLARMMDIDEKQLVHIRRGVLLHDVGKMGVSGHILQKPGRLTDDEWEIIQQHPVYAYKWLAPILYLKPALDIPYFHHEKWDGSGYPHGLKGDQIPLPARIFAIVDVWLALLSDRPYRKAWTKEKALAYIREQSGIHFDPQVVDAFIELLKRDGEITSP